MRNSLLNATTPLGRRTFLQAGGLSALGLSLPQLLAVRDAAANETAARDAAAQNRPAGGTAKACILLYMLGGPPQQETFDPKPQAPGTARSLFPTIATNVPGIEICGLLPDLARQADRLAIVRSVFHRGDALFHGAGVHYNLTGWPNFPREGEPLIDRRDHPGIAAVLTQLQGARPGLPPAVQLPQWITQDGPGREWAGQHAGFLGRRFDPLIMTYEGEKNLPGVLPPGYSLREDVTRDRLSKRLALQETLGRQQVGAGTGAIRDWTNYQAQALGVLSSSTAWRAFSIDDEPAALKARYGDDKLGRSCLVARRLVEAGVTLVTVVFGGWDTHSHHEEHTRDLLLPPLNRAFGALLDDLAVRGLLDSTLVAWTGEFGRTPAINGNKPPGRDHWARVYSTVLAGGGIRGGQVYGKSDNLAAEPKDDPVPVADFVATLYHALGYDRETQVVDPLGRSHYIVAGQPLRNLF
jgi:Protein of unknown function (DUF1501)